MEDLLDREIVKRIIRENNLDQPGSASIRELVALVDGIEEATGVRFIRMEMGIPGLPPSPYGTAAEIAALQGGVANRYPSIVGIPALKANGSRFVKAFLGIDVPARCCLPCSGSTNGSFISFMVTGRMFPSRSSILFLDPGFPVHKLQVGTLGLKQLSLDIYDHRGEKLRKPLEDILKTREVSTILYSNPNNPAWICLTETELAIIGQLCAEYDVVALEDLAYLGMDFRKDLSVPGRPPYQATVARYTQNWIMLISSSKLFSYAGQRIGMVAVSEELFDRRFPALEPFFRTPRFGHALVYGAAYAVSAGVAHSTQHGLAAIFDAAASGDYPLLDQVRIYGQRAKAMKRIFLENGFRLVYDKDENLPLADGFYFTVAFGDLSGDELVEELLYYGVSALSLSRTGSRRGEGIRACVSLVDESQFPELSRRLKMFCRAHQERLEEPSRIGD